MFTTIQETIHNSKYGTGSEAIPAERRVITHRADPTVTTARQWSGDTAVAATAVGAVSRQHSHRRCSRRAGRRKT